MIPKASVMNWATKKSIDNLYQENMAMIEDKILAATKRGYYGVKIDFLPFTHKTTKTRIIQELLALDYSINYLGINRFIIEWNKVEHDPKKEPEKDEEGNPTEIFMEFLVELRNLGFPV